MNLPKFQVRLNPFNIFSASAVATAVPPSPQSDASGSNEYNIDDINKSEEENNESAIMQ